jgi:transposase InsO family protein
VTEKQTLSTNDKSPRLLYCHDRTKEGSDILIDSGASLHVINDLNLFIEGTETVHPPAEVECASGKILFIHKKGLAHIPTLVKGNIVKTLSLQAYYCPREKFPVSVISLSRLRSDQYTYVAEDNRINRSVQIFSSTKEIVGEGDENFYLIQPGRDKKGNNYAYSLKSNSQPKSIQLDINEAEVLSLHHRLGHMNFKDLYTLNKTYDLGIKIIKEYDYFCPTCALTKAQRHKVKQKFSTSAPTSRPNEKVYVDLKGPIKPVSQRGHYAYVMLIIDDFSRYFVVYFLKQKSDAAECLQHFVTSSSTNVDSIILLKENTDLEVETLYQRESLFPVSTLHSDNGGEFMSRELGDFLKRHGVKKTFTTAYSPYSNGIVERAIRTLFETASSLLNYSGLPARLFWPEAIQRAAYIRNRIPHSYTKLPPLELYKGVKVNKYMLHALHPFGAEAYATIPKQSAEGKQRDTFSPKAKTTVYLGDSNDRRASLLYDMSDGIVIERNDVKINSHVFPFTHLQVEQTTTEEKKEGKELFPNMDQPLSYDDKKDNLSPVSEEINPRENKLSHPMNINKDDVHNNDSSSTSFFDDNDSSSSSFFPQSPVKTNISHEKKKEKTPVKTESKSIPVVPIPRRYPVSNRVPSEKAVLNQIQQIDKQTSKTSAIAKSIQHTNADPHERKLPSGEVTLKSAMRSNEWNHWQDAIKSELTKQRESGTWKEKSIPFNKVSKHLVISSRWVLTWKTQPDSTVKYKARLVARGYEQGDGSYDPYSLYAPTVAATSVRILFALAAFRGYVVEHVDFQTAFLNAELTEEIYLSLPRGTSDVPDNHVVRLVKSLYGLKQSPNNWYIKLRTFLSTLGYKPLIYDKCVYYNSKDDIVMSTHVDDIQIVAPNASKKANLVDKIQREFKITDLGDIIKFRGLDVSADSKYILLHQKTNIRQMILDLDLDGRRNPTSPAPSNSKNAQSQEPCPNTMFRSLVGRLNYLATNTRADISASLMLLARKCEQPTKGDYFNLTQIALYLNGTTTVGPKYRIMNIKSKSERIPLCAYADASYASIDETHSVSGGVIMLNGGPIFWTSHKQSTTPLSSTEAELVSVTSLVRETITYRNLLAELGVKTTTPTPIYTDSKSLHTLSVDLANASKSKLRSVRPKIEYLRELIADKTISLIWIEGVRNFSDILTKTMYGTHFQNLRDQLFHSIPDQDT